MSSQAGLTDTVARKIRMNENAVIISLLSTQLSNLKAVLKHINRQATSQIDVDGDEDLAERGHYLNYDLKMLYDHLQSRSIRKVVLYFQDTEGFSEVLLSDLIDILRYLDPVLILISADYRSAWMDRIPFVLLFGIATSIELFEEKLSQATLRLLEGNQFEIAQLGVDVLFKAVTRSERPSNFWLGAGLGRYILRQHKDHVQTATDFVRTIKVYMLYDLPGPIANACSIYTCRTSFPIH